MRFRAARSAVWGGLLLAIATTPTWAQARSPLDVLREALRSGALGPATVLSYTATCEAETHDPFSSVTGVTGRTRYVERVDGPRQRRRIDYQAPGQLLNIVVLEDPTSIYQWDTQRGIAIRQDNNACAMLPSIERDRLAILSENYTASIVGKSTVAGRPCLIVEVMPVRQGNPWRRIYVDRDKLLPLRTENANGAGFLTHSMAVVDISYSIPGDPGMFQLPPGTIVRDDPVERSVALPMNRLEEKAGFAPIAPGYVPAGYRFAGGQVIRAGDSTVIHLMYFDGMSTVSLFEELVAPGARGGGQDWMPGEVGASGLSWVAPGGAVAFTLIGDVLPQELEKVKGSLR